MKEGYRPLGPLPPTGRPGRRPPTESTPRDRLRSVLGPGPTPPRPRRRVTPSRQGLPGERLALEEGVVMGRNESSLFEVTFRLGYFDLSVNTD